MSEPIPYTLTTKARAALTSETAEWAAHKAAQFAKDTRTMTALNKLLAQTPQIRTQEFPMHIANPLTITCPTCGATPGNPCCISDKPRLSNSHSTRALKVVGLGGFEHLYNPNMIIGKVVNIKHVSTTYYGNPIIDLTLESGAGYRRTYRISHNSGMSYGISNEEYEVRFHYYTLTKAGRINNVTCINHDCRS